MLVLSGFVTKGCVRALRGCAKAHRSKGREGERGYVRSLPDGLFPLPLFV